MITTRITKDYGIEAPIILAGMAFVAMSDLVVAVSNAGGLGVLGGSMPAPVLRSELAKIKKATRKPYGVNFIPRVIEKEHIDICIEERVPLVVFYWDEAPPAFISQLKQNNIKVWVQVGSLSEASAAVSAGADAVIVQGSEAGGHNRSTAATFTLLPSVVDLISPIPVIASGGIADGRGIVAALALGAEAVWVGTRFVASREAYAHPAYKERIVAASVHDTARHNIFGYDFPDATVRGLRNDIVREWEGKDNPPPYAGTDPSSQPLIGETALFGQRMGIAKFMGFPPTPDASGDLEQMSLLAGESVGLVKALAPAGDIVRAMRMEAEKIISDRLQTMTR